MHNVFQNERDGEKSPTPYQERRANQLLYEEEREFFSLRTNLQVIAVIDKRAPHNIRLVCEVVTVGNVKWKPPE